MLVFASHTHSQIRRSSIDVQKNSQPINIPKINPSNISLTQLYLEHSPGNAQCVWDPWDEYDSKQQQKQQQSQITINEFIHKEPVETLNTNLINTEVVHHQFHDNNDNNTDNHVPLIPTYVENQSQSQLNENASINIVNIPQCVTVIDEIVPILNEIPIPDPIEQIIEPTTTTTTDSAENNVNTIEETTEQVIF